MSRIGRLPVAIPQGVDVKLEGATVTVKGPKGSLSQMIHQDMQVVVSDSEVAVARPSDEKKHKSLHGLTRSLIANMVEGVTQGFQRDLELIGVGYRAAVQGKKLVLNVGYSNPVEIEPEPGIEIECPIPTQIVVKGIDKQLVGQTAADIRKVRPPEPYLGKGIRYKGEYVRRKAGKAGKTG